VLNLSFNKEKTMNLEVITVKQLIKKNIEYSYIKLKENLFVVKYSLNENLDNDNTNVYSEQLFINQKGIELLAKKYPLPVIRKSMNSSKFKWMNYNITPIEKLEFILNTLPINQFINNHILPDIKRKELENIQSIEKEMTSQCFDMIEAYPEMIKFITFKTTDDNILLDINEDPIPQIINFNYIDGHINSKKYDIKELIILLSKRDDIIFYDEDNINSVDHKKIKLIPQIIPFQEDEENYTLYFGYKPNKEDYKKIIENYNNNIKNNEYAPLPDIVIQMNLLDTNTVKLENNKIKPKGF
jgi:hypothetical protein